MKSEAEKTKYNQDYYDKNKAAINKRRRRIYNTDAVVRLRTQKAARERYTALSSSPNKNIGYTVKKVDGVALYTIQYVVGVTGLSAESIRDWERKGIIPKSVYTDSRKWRLYTSEQIEFLGTAFKNYAAGKWSVREVRKFLWDSWKGDNHGG